MTDGSFLSYDGDDDVDDDQYEQDEWCDDDHVGEEGVDRWQLSLAGAESHPPARSSAISGLALLCSAPAASHNISALLSISHCSALLLFCSTFHTTSALLWFPSPFITISSALLTLPLPRPVFHIYDLLNPIFHLTSNTLVFSTSSNLRASFSST